MQVTHLKSYWVPIAAAQPPSGWRRGLRGAPPNGEGAMLRIGPALQAGTGDPPEPWHLVIDAAQAAAGS